MPELALNKKPNSRLVITHYLTSGLGFLLVALSGVIFPEAFIGHYFSPELLAITHLAVFGWVTMLIFGSLYQLLPVISGNALFSEKMAFITYFLLIAGIPFLVIDFFQFDLSSLVHIGGTLITLAIGCFTVNLFKTLSGKEATLEKDFIGTSGIWLLTNVILGLILALNLRYAFLPKEHLAYLKLHAHIGGAGWFLSLIMGVGSRLIPMFSLSHGVSQKGLRWAYWLLQGGLIIMLIEVFGDLPVLKPFIVLALMGAIISYLLFIREAFHKRMRRNPDLNMTITFRAFIGLLIPVAIGTLIGLWKGNTLGAEWGLIYGVTFFIGFMGLLIIGQTFKTFPFILWMAHIQPFAGNAQISMPQDLIDTKKIRVMVIFYLAGTLLLLTGIGLQGILWIRFGGILLTAAIGLYNLQLYLSLMKALNEKKTLHYATAKSTGTGGATSNVTPETSD